MLEFVVIFFLLTVIVAVLFLLALAVKAGLAYLPAVIKKVARSARKEGK